MFYVYVLKSLSNSLHYIGSTADLKRRVADHNDAKSKWTKSGRPWKLIYYEAFTNRLLAQRRERKLKQFGKRWSELKKRIGLIVTKKVPDDGVPIEE